MPLLNAPTTIVLVSLPWWVWYFIRLRHVQRHGHLIRRPRIYLWVLVYGIGLLYYLYPYELEQRLQTYVAFSHLPLISLSKLGIASGIVTYGYISLVRHYTKMVIPRYVDRSLLFVIALTLLVNLALYLRIPYWQLQCLTNILMNVGNIMTAILITPMLRKLRASRQSIIQAAHQGWYLVFMVACAVSAGLYVLDGFVKLYEGQGLAPSPLATSAQVSQGVYMILLAILIGPDRYLYWAYYPRLLITYWRLKRLAQHILTETGAEPIYAIPLPSLPTLTTLEFVVYQLFIIIMDSYDQLPQDAPLRSAIQALDQTNASYEATIWQLQKLIQEV